MHVFCSPSRYVQGKDAFNRLGEELNYLGIKGSVLVLASEGTKKRTEAKWAESLQREGYEYFFVEFGHECTYAEIDRVAEIANSKKVSAIVGIGGGKTIDTARAAAEKYKGEFVSCPTLASNDAPCSALSCIYNEQGVYVDYILQRKNPILILVDTQIIAQAPKRLLVAGMGDAIATHFEAETCANANATNFRGGKCTLSGRGIARKCYETLLENGVPALEAMNHKHVTPELEHLVEANTLMSGLGFESCGIAAAHSIYNGMTQAIETESYYHGEKVAFGLIAQFVMESKSQKEFDELLGFYHRVGLPMTFAEVGMEKSTRETLQKIGDFAVEKMDWIHFEPVEVTGKLVVETMLSADEIGRNYQKKHGKKAA